MKYLTNLFLGLVFSSCAVISTSQFESAKTLEEGQAQFGVGVGMGREVATGLFFGSDKENFPSPIIEFYGKGNIASRIDAGLGWWLSSGSVGVKGSMKFQLSNNDSKYHVAINPGISWTGSDFETNINDKSGHVSAVSAHVPLLWSAHPSKMFAVYGGFHYIFTHVSLQDENGLNRYRDLHTPGFTFGLQGNFGPVSLMPEFSVYSVRDFILSRSQIVFFPNFGLAFNF